MPRDEAGAIGEVGWRPSEVHPLAELFPMMEPDDLKALAEDIKANGLQQPVVVDRTGRLIDGRNRLAACEKADVEPDWRVIEAEEAEAFIWGANVKRRQMSRGQIAMIAAVSYVNPDITQARKEGRPDRGITKTAKMVGVSHPTMLKAFLVKEYAPDLVPGIIAGKLFLDAAHATAQARKKEADWLDDGLRLLRKQDPDLARRVMDGELTLEAARKLLDERAKAEASSRQAVLLDILGMTRSAIGFRDSETLRKVPDWLASEDGVRDHLRYFEGGPAEILQRIEEARAGLDAVAAVYSSLSEKA